MFNFDDEDKNYNSIDEMPFLSRNERRAVKRNFKYFIKAVEMYGEKIMDNPVFILWHEMLVKAPMKRVNIYKPWLNDFLKFAEDMTSKPGSPCTFEEVLKDVDIKAQNKH